MAPKTTQSNELLEPLHSLLERAETLSLLITAQDWQALEDGMPAYEQQASFLNDEAYTNALINTNQAEEAQAIIAKIQQLNDIMDRAAVENRDKIAAELRQMNQSNKALDAYGR